MPVKCVPLVAETISNKPNATGTFTLSGADSAVPGARTVTSQYADGEELIGRVENADKSMFEEAVYQFTASGTTLARVSVTHSSNSDAAVDFSASATALTFTTDLIAQDAQNTIIATETHITGLGLVFNSTTSISVKPGSAYIPGTNKVCNVPSLITDSSLTGLTANIWYYVYLYDNAGTPAIEVSSTAPATAYAGNARTKTGDTTRRFIGTFHTITGGAIQGFKHSAKMGFYEYGGPSSPYTRVLANGTASTDATFSCAVGIPPQSTHGYFRVINAATGGGGGGAGFAPGGTTDAYNNSTYVQANSGDMVVFIPTDTSQQLTYRFDAAPTGGGAYCDILGFLLEV